MMVEIIQATTAEHLAQVRHLLLEYSASRAGDPALRDFPEEIANLPGGYSPPQGCLLLALYDGQPSGCVALRRCGDGVGEIKRLYVRPAYRGKQIGKALAEEIIARARQMGYARIRLDTIPGMDAAQALYRSMGFREIPPYRYNPNPGTLFFELALAD